MKGLHSVQIFTKQSIGISTVISVHLHGFFFRVYFHTSASILRNWLTKFYWKILCNSCESLVTRYHTVSKLKTASNVHIETEEVFCFEFIFGFRSVFESMYIVNAIWTVTYHGPHEIWMVSMGQCFEWVLSTVHYMPKNYFTLIVPPTIMVSFVNIACSAKNWYNSTILQEKQRMEPKTITV